MQTLINIHSVEQKEDTSEMYAHHARLRTSNGHTRTLSAFDNIRTMPGMWAPREKI